MDDVKSLTHTKWNCKYHIVFAPKYRRKVFYEEKRMEIGTILRELCRWKGVEIIEAEVMPRSYSYVGKHPAQDECIRIYGVSERKKQSDDISTMGQHEIQVQESAILVQRVLRGYCHIFLWTLF